MTLRLCIPIDAGALRLLNGKRVMSLDQQTPTRSLIREIDYGTPASKAHKKVALSIDSKQISVPEGTSVMRAAMEAGIEIPKLCATDMLDAFGSCRLCLIEMEGRTGTPASCTTPVAEGMVVRTQSDRLDRLRKGIMELYVSDHPVDSLDRSKYPDVDLLETVAAVGLKEVRYGFDGARHRNPGIDDSNPYFSFDPAKCIVCSRCVRACEEVQGTFALTVSGRGFDSIIAAGMDEKFIESECVSCGACVQACPTGSLLEKKVIEEGKPEWSALTTCGADRSRSGRATARSPDLSRTLPAHLGRRVCKCFRGRVLRETFRTGAAARQNWPRRCRSYLAGQGFLRHWRSWLQI
jgi:formate dehydrogenase major subunit